MLCTLKFIQPIDLVLVVVFVADPSRIVFRLKHTRNANPTALHSRSLYIKFELLFI